MGAVQGKRMYSVQHASARHRHWHRTATGRGRRRSRRLLVKPPFLGPQRRRGQHASAQSSPPPLPRRLFRKRSQLVEEVFMAGDQSPWRSPSFPVFSCCTAQGLQLGLWASVTAGREGAQGLWGEEGLAHWPLPQPLSPPDTLGGTEMGVRPCGGKGLVGVKGTPKLQWSKGSCFSLPRDGCIVSRSCRHPG